MARATRTQSEMEIQVRQAPRWVWAVLDETIEMDTLSHGIDPYLRAEIRHAFECLQAWDGAPGTRRLQQDARD